MADNGVREAANAVGAIQYDGNPPAVIPQAVALIAPGAVYPYSLSDEGVEEPFEPISWFAIRESGGSRQFGPLDEEKLKTFLRHKLDRRQICTKDVIQKYTDDVNGLYIQLKNLKHRITQIKDAEKEGADYIKKRIREFEKALKENKPMPAYLPYALSLSSSTNEAFQSIGSHGPLDEIQLKHLIHTGQYDYQVPTDQLIKQLQDLRLRINDNLDIEKHKVKLPYERVMKALDDILREIMTMPMSNRRSIT